MPDIKARAGDREGSGAQEGSLEHRGLGREGAHRGAPGSADRVRRENAALEGMGQPVAA